MEVCQFLRAHHAVVFILPSAVIYVEENHFLTEPMCLQEKVKPTDKLFAPLPHSPALSVRKLTWRGRAQYTSLVLGK